jgi:hypothetical protein
MNEDKFYEQHKQCLDTGISERFKRTDLLHCTKFDCFCGLIACIEGHEKEAKNVKHRELRAKLKEGGVYSSKQLK